MQSCVASSKHRGRTITAGKRHFSRALGLAATPPRLMNKAGPAPRSPFTGNGSRCRAGLVRNQEDVSFYLVGSPT